MQQSMLALLALLMLTTVAVQRQRAAAEQQIEIVRNELSLMATGVAIDRLEEVNVLAFDEATRFDETVAAAGELTASGAFGPAQDTPSDDVDDLHAVVADTIRTVGADTLRFRVETTVEYASAADPDLATAGPTKFKKVSVKAYVIGMQIAFVDTVRLSKSVACGSACGW